MPEFETLPREQKLDLVLKTMLVYGNGVIADLTLAQLYRCDLDNVEQVTELLMSDGMVEVVRFDKPDDWAQISITAEGRLFSSQGGYTSKPKTYETPGLSSYDNDFHEFSRKMHLLKITIFWIVGILMAASCIYVLLAGHHV